MTTKEMKDMVERKYDSIISKQRIEDIKELNLLKDSLKEEYNNANNELQEFIIELCNKYNFTDHKTFRFGYGMYNMDDNKYFTPDKNPTKDIVDLKASHQKRIENMRNEQQKLIDELLVLGVKDESVKQKLLDLINM